ncbi:MAG TPA: diguanylate cyclase [Acidimicrobiales bacterium]|nr:diguanylate cyclase [Acidimicrobiales bacterium]
MADFPLEKKQRQTDAGGMVDHRALPGLGAGLAGLSFGVAAIVLQAPLLALGAGMCALAAGAAAVVQVQRLVRSEAQVSASAALANLLDLPQQAREQAHSLVDKETGLPDGRFLELAIEGRIAAARRHLWPVTIVLLEVGLRPECVEVDEQDRALIEFATLLRRALREADVVCRTSRTGFALVLEDTAEEGGVWVAERVQIAMAQEGGGARRLTAGVASYPIHGLHADHVLARSQAALTRACAAGAGRGLGQVEVAQPDFA